MILNSCSIILRRRTKCTTLAKFFLTRYSTRAKQATKDITSLKEPPYISVPKNYHARTVNIELPLNFVTEPANILDNKIFNEKRNIKTEWRNLVLDTTKLGKHCLMLSKIRLTSLVIITTMGGYALAPAPFDLSTFLLCSLGTGLVSATANCINQFFEVPFDAQMSRTKNRVLVCGHLTPAHAAAFAVISGITGLSILYTGVNGVTALLGASNLVLYTCVYTPLKRISIVNTWVGSIVGAIPPLMGWAGCAGDISAPGAWIMSGMLYAWQFPHFNALSWNLRPDYSRAGYRMMAVTDPELCRKTALRYTVVLSGLSYLAPLLDVTHWWFAAASTPLNAYFLYLAWNFYKESDSASSRKLFRFSLVHLPALMLLMLVSKKQWFSENKKDTVEPLDSHQRNNLWSYLLNLAPVSPVS
ncbi:protoheme IX farnesyltransferase, mitochondrial [Prorops nasuta]|uniref:protoheme IX farnesyltransferase, mitochondrial n=1 Tax=Prorops nasuta TaxID=863751 RepID=UPI0034CEBD61